MDTFNELNAEFERIHHELENDNYEAEDQMIELEEKAREAVDFTDGIESKKLRNLLGKIKMAKNEFDFFDADAELDNMFPNRHDDDFDEDSMSYDSVFGDD
jgi:hypothetical protein